jgi:hypothetical protein
MYFEFCRGLQDHLALLLPNSHSTLVVPQPYPQWQHLSRQVRIYLINVDGLLPVETCNWYYKRELCHQYKVIPDSWSLIFSYHDMLSGVFTTEALCRLHLFALPCVIGCLSTCNNLWAMWWIFVNSDVVEYIKFCQYIPVLVYIDKNSLHFLLKYIHFVFVTLFSQFL